MKKNLWKVLALTLSVWVALILAGCGGAGGGTISRPALPVFVPGSVTEADRARAISEVTDYYKTVAGQANAIDQVIAFMKAMPEFATAEKSMSGDAVGFFKDGRMHAVIQPTPQRESRSTRTSTSASEPRVATTRELPGANKAYLINVSEGAIFNTIPTIDPILTMRGYDTIVLDGAVSDFAQIRDAGVLYLKTLAFQGRNQFDRDHTWFVTTTPVNEGTIALYQPQFDAGTMSTASVLIDSTGEEPVYGNRMLVSEEFLQSSGMTFSSNAIWINEVPWGADPQMANVAGNFPGVRSYWSWSRRYFEVDAWETTLFLFSRFLGTSYADLGEDVPYSVSEAQAAVGNTARSAGGGTFAKTSFDASSTFAAFSKVSMQSADVTMIPSIRSATIDKTENTMAIEGLFGSEPGAVTIDGSTLNVLDWTPKKVTVEAPTATKGALVLRSLGGASASGQLLSKPFEWEDIVFSIIPGEVALRKQESKSFTVSATGAGLPAGSTYRWTLSGEGLVNGSTSFTGPATTVTFQAPNSEGETVLNVEVLSPSGSKLGDAFAVIGIGDNRISYVASGVTNYPQLNGEFAFADGRGSLFKGQTTDEYEFGYNWDNVSGFPRVVVLLEVPANTVLAPGQEYNWSSVPGVVGYNFGTTESLTDPTENGNLLLYGFEGKLLITSVSTNPNGSLNVGYSFQVGSDADPSTFGSGSIVVTTEGP